MHLDWGTIWEQLDAWFLRQGTEGQTWADLKEEMEKVIEAQLRQQNAA